MLQVIDFIINGTLRDNSPAIHMLKSVDVFDRGHILPV